MAELLIIGSGCVLGYLLNKNGKQNRNSNKTVIISPNRLPSGPLIYDSNRVKQVDEYVRDLAAKKHADKVKQMFPYDYDQPVNIFPDDGNSGQPVHLLDLQGHDFSDAASKSFQKNQATAIATNVNTAAFNPSSGNVFMSNVTPTNINNSPMFRDFQATGATGTTDPTTPQFQLAAADSYSEFSAPISLLTGKPLDMTHANMQPMFGSMVKQPSVSNENSQVLLERFSGVPSSDNQGTYSQKREVVNPLPSNPENLQTASIGQLSDLMSRAQFGVKPTNDYMSPVKAFRDMPTKELPRVLPPTIDQIRGPNNPQVTYSGVMIPGQKGSNRGVLPSLRENRYDLLTETKGQDLVGNKAMFGATTMKVIPQVRNTNATSVTQVSYLAPPTDQRGIVDFSALAQTYKQQIDDTVTRQMESFTPSLGIAKGREKAPNTGVFMMRDPEKGFAQEYISQPFKNLGSAPRNVSSPNPTLRDTLVGKSTGSMNVSGKKDNTAWKKTKVKLEPTSKSMNEKNPHIGQPKQSLGMGYRKQKFEQWSTLKEANQFSQSGNPKGLNVLPVDKNAKWELDTNKEVSVEHYGVATGPNAKPVSDGGMVIPDVEKLMVKDYYNNPTGMSKERNRDDYIESVTPDAPRVEFGGYLAGAKMGNGEDGNRSGQVRLKQEMTVEGRTNVPLRREKLGDHLSAEANFKPEVITVPRDIVTRTQPSDIPNPHDIGVQMRTKNTEALNSRLDTSTKITNDLYPWIKDKGE
jgi:hypothetical protein